MPKVGKMKFPYTKKGVEEAQTYASQLGKRMEVENFRNSNSLRDQLMNIQKIEGFDDFSYGVEGYDPYAPLTEGDLYERGIDRKKSRKGIAKGALISSLMASSIGGPSGLGLAPPLMALVGSLLDKAGLESFGNTRLKRGMSKKEKEYEKWIKSIRKVEPSPEIGAGELLEELLGETLFKIMPPEIPKSPWSNEELKNVAK